MTRYVAASLVVAALIAFLYVVRILVDGLMTGVLSIRAGTWERAKQPTAYWSKIAVMAVFLLVPILIGALAALTLIG